MANRENYVTNTNTIEHCEINALYIRDLNNNNHYLIGRIYVDTLSITYTTTYLFAKVPKQQ